MTEAGSARKQRPPGRSTRWISLMAPGASTTVNSREAMTASTLRSGQSSASASPCSKRQLPAPPTPPDRGRARRASATGRCRRCANLGDARPAGARRGRGRTRFRARSCQPGTSRLRQGSLDAIGVVAEQVLAQEPVQRGGPLERLVDAGRVRDGGRADRASGTVQSACRRRRSCVCTPTQATTWRVTRW